MNGSFAVERFHEKPDAVRAQGYFVTEREPTPEQLMANPRVARVVRGTGYNAVRTSMDVTFAKRPVRSARRAYV